MEKENFTLVTKLQHDLLTAKYTEVFFVAGQNSKSPTRFLVIKPNDDTITKLQEFSEKKAVSEAVCEINFQDGPIKEFGVETAAIYVILIVSSFFYLFLDCFLFPALPFQHGKRKTGKGYIRFLTAPPVRD